jgi:arylsulfatase A-like enzyme
MIVALASCAEDPAPDTTTIRNLVLVSLDALGAKHTGAYGYARPTTPHLDQLAREGVLFERAYAQQVWTLTSHLSMLTGLYPQVHGASKRRPARRRAPNLAERLAEAGFETASFVATDIYMSPRFGFARGFGHYKIQSGDARQVNRARFAWLEQQARRQRTDPEHRFFLVAHYYDIHSDVGSEVPYAAPPPYSRQFLPEGTDWGRAGDTSLLLEMQRSGEVTDEDRVALTAFYDGGVRYCDEECLGALLAELRRLDLYEQTLVVVTSDHGEEIFEHGMCSHQQPYEETARVPLVFRGPSLAEGRRVDATVELVDLMPTLLSLVDLEVPSDVQGRDLSAWLRAGVPTPEVEPRDAHVDGIWGGLPDIYWRYPSALTSELEGRRWSYVNLVHHAEDGTGFRFELRQPGEVYDLDQDPLQQRNLAARLPDMERILGERLLRWYAENDSLARRLGEPEQDGPILDEKERERLRALGYVH